MQHSDIEQLLVDIHAAKAFLDRVEFQVRNLTSGSATSVGKVEDVASREVASAPGPGETDEDRDPDVTRDTDAVCESKGEVQPDLFDIFGSPHEKTEEKRKPKNGVSAQRKGAYTLTRRQVLANFREIVGDRKILDLADVNRIFGYNKSTSGTFVKHAIKRGELGTIPYGAQGAKFLMIDVRRFIKQYFDRIEAQKNGGVK